MELTDTATSFLMARMHREDADGDGALSRVEQLQLFATAPDNPWERAPYSNTLVETSKVPLRPPVSLTWQCLQSWLIRLQSSLHPDRQPVHAGTALPLASTCLLCR